MPGDTEVDPLSVRLFLDLEGVYEGVQVSEDRLVYRVPDTLADGTHTVSVVAQTLDGGKDHVRWTFHVGAPSGAAAPGVTALLVVVVLVPIVAWARRRPAS